MGWAMAFETQKIGLFFRFRKGLGYLGKYLTDSDVALIGLNSFEPGGGYKHGGEKCYSGPFKAEHLAKCGDLFISTTDITQDGRVLGSPFIFPNLSNVYSEVIFSHDIVKAIPISPGLSPNHLANILRIPRYRKSIANASTGTTVRRVPVDVIGELEVPVPPIAIQNAICAFVDSLDEKIRLNTEMSKTLEAIAQTIFKSWFIDFDPVHAKMRGEKPEGMDDATAALFPDSFDESELGMIPKGWEVKSLDAIARFLNGLALQKFPPHDGSDNLPVIKIAQLRAGNTTGADFASKQIKSEYIIKDGDILFSWSGTLEVEYWTGGDGALNQHLFKVTGNTVPDWFAFLATRYFLEDFRSIARSKATTMGHIQRGHLTEAKMPLADTGLLGVADSIISPLIELLVSKRIEANQLAALRDALLPRLISGELEIPDEMLAS